MLEHEETVSYRSTLAKNISMIDSNHTATEVLHMISEFKPKNFSPWMCGEYVDEQTQSQQLMNELTEYLSDKTNIPKDKIAECVKDIETKAQESSPYFGCDDFNSYLVELMSRKIDYPKHLIESIVSLWENARSLQTIQQLQKMGFVC